MKKFFVGIYQWIMKLALEYQQQKSGLKKYKYTKCSYCGKRHLFDVSDVTKDMKMSEVVFVCNAEACQMKHTKTFYDVEDMSQELKDFVPEPILQENPSTCEHRTRDREYYRDGVYKCWGCGKIINENNGEKV